MKKPLVLLILGILLPAFAIAQGNLAESHWVSTPVTIDGNSEEWGTPLRFSDSNGLLSYSIENDSTTLYFCIKSLNPAIGFKMMRSGIKLILNEKGNKKHNASLLFPATPSEMPHQTAEQDKNKRPDITELRNNFLIENTTLKAEGFAKTNGILPVRNQGGFNVAVGWDENNAFTYEAAIPLKEFLGDDFNGKNWKNKINLIIEIDGVSRPSAAGQASDRSFHQGMRRGDGEGSRVSGEGPGNFSGDRQHHYGEGGYSGAGNRNNFSEKTEIKQKFVLSGKK